MGTIEEARMDVHAPARGSATRRVVLGLGSRIAAFAALVAAGAGLTPVDAAPRRKKKKKPVVRRFAPNMVGTNEVPSTSGDPNGLGSAVFKIKNNGNTICARFTVQSLSPGSVIQMTHIHQGVAGATGPVRVDFHGHLNHCARVPRGLANQITSRPGGFYANLHTDLFPDGAIRAQLRARP
jgi:hypothetical protein